MKCKNCGKTQHYCSSCDREPCLDHDTCSIKCMREYYDYDSFLTFYYRLYNFSCTNDFERSIIEDEKHELWESWCYEKSNQDK